jgi:hypothetical protein
MNPARPSVSLYLFTVLVTGALGLCPASATTPSPAIQKRIDALLKHRLKPEALPVNPPNPFQMTSGPKRELAPDELSARPAISDDVAAPASTEGQVKELAATSQAEVLVSCATRLKLGGIIIIKEQIQIVINGVPRKEGDAVSAEWNNNIVQLRVARLVPGHLVLRYGEAEATIKF